MKLAKYIIPIALLSAGMTSCVDLDYTEVTTNDEEWVYQSPVYGVQRLVTSVYARIPNGFDKNYEGGSGSTLAAATDEADCAISSSSVHRFYNGGWSPQNPFSFTWENSYSAIAEANNFLEKLDKIDLSDYESNTDYAAMKAKFELFEYQVRYLRAFFYFELVRAYGDVPFTLKTLSPGEANSLTRRPALEIMDWIVEELDQIAEYLPISYTTELNQDIGRATRPMCLALKARTLLYKASPLFNTGNNKEWWLDAARANHDVIRYAGEWGISLGNYADLWGANNGDGVEVIMASKQGSINSWETYNYPIGVENGQGGMCPTQTLVDAYEYADGTGETFGQRHAGTTVNVTAENAYSGLDPRFGMTVVKNGDRYEVETDGDGIHVGAFLGNFCVDVKAYTYILTLGRENIKMVGPLATLNANYIKESLKDVYELPIPGLCKHEFVFNGLKDKSTGVTTMDVAKRLLDFGFHAPTIYFPLLFHEAMMIEPTENETKATIDAFIGVMREIAREAAEEPETVKGAPNDTPIGRVDDVLAAKQPVLKF